jgi:hypothetical protein
VKARHVIQLILAVTLVATALRLGVIYYERHAPAPNSGPQAALDPDYYVVPKKLHAYDVKTARAGMVGHPAWVREGYKFTYYRYDPGGHHTDFAHPAGLLLPLQQLDVRDVVLTLPPAAGELPQIVAVFETGGQEFAVPIGARQGEDYTLDADDMLFFEDPHQLYRHWAPEVWQAVDHHQVMLGMNEIQVWFALGMGIPQPAGDQPGKTVVYPDGGKPTTVVFRAGRAVDIRP